MPKVPDIIPVSDLRQDAAAVIKRIRESGEPVVVTQRGRASVVILSVDAYEQSEEERQILKVLARGEQEIQTGTGHSLASVIKEADKLLEAE